MGIGYFPREKQPVRGVDHLHNLAPRFKKEYSYTSTPPLGFRGLLWGEIYPFYTFITTLAPTAALH